MSDTNTLVKNQRILAINDNPNLIEDWRQLFEDCILADDWVIDNEKSTIVHYSSSFSREAGFEIDSAFQGQEGLEKIRHAYQEGRPYVVAFVDVRMPPGWDGVNTIEQIWAEYPDLPVVIHAPYSDYSAPEIIERLGASEKLLIFKYPPDNEAIHRFAVAITKGWECKQATQFEQVLMRAAKLPWARILDPDWIRKLAENGDIHCMYDLGCAYLTGYPGVPQDRSQAIKWLQEATRLGNQDAKDKLVAIGEMVVMDSDFIDQPRINRKIRWKHVLRWLAVLPGSVVCVILAMFPIHWAVMLIQFSFKEGDTIYLEGPVSFLACIPPEILERLGYAIFTPMVLIVVGSKIAPKYKFQVGIAMSIFWGLLFGCGTGIGIARIFNMNWILYSITLALGVTGCIAGLLLVHKNQRETFPIE